MENFDFDKYSANIKAIADNIFKRKPDVELISDILLELVIKEHEKKFRDTKIIKQIQMKVGELWQIAIGNWYQMEDLGIGHKTGLDILSNEKKIIIELKNRYNTDNSSSRKANNSKLAKFKKDNPEYKCIYGIINDTKTEGKQFKYKYDGQELEYMSGNIFLTFIFGEYKEKVLILLKELISNYIN